MSYFIKIIYIIIFLFFSFKVIAVDGNRILFTIENEAFTKIDLDNRLKYIELLNNIKINEIEKKEILEDYISANLFNIYNKKINENVINIESEINNFYNLNFQNIENKNNLKKIEILSIKNNIKIDLIRKKIIEGFLNTKKEKLKPSTNDLELIYSYNIRYLNFKTKEFNSDKLPTILTRNDLYKFENFLLKNNIQFFVKEEELIDLNKIKNSIKKSIIENKTILTIKNKDYFTIISIEKKLESYEGVYVKLVNFKINKKLNNNELNCNFVRSIVDKVTFKEYEYSKLNDTIKNNLFSVNDYIYFDQNDSYNYIFLCELKFDKNILNNINFNKKVLYFANKLEKNFIIKYSKILNLELIQ